MHVCTAPSLGTCILDLSCAGATSDAQLAQAEEACARERERYEQESEEHSRTKDRASELQVSKHSHWQYTFHLKYM